MIQPPVIQNMVASTAYPILLQSGGVSSLTVILRSGEVYLKPILSAPASTMTTDSASNVGTGIQVITPTAMTNIKVGSLLNLDSGDSRESVIVTDRFTVLSRRRIDRYALTLLDIAPGRGLDPRQRTGARKWSDPGHAMFIELAADAHRPPMCAWILDLPSDLSLARR